MSSSSKDNRFLFLALAAVAAAGLAYVMMQESGTDSKETQEVEKLQDDDIPDAVSEKTTNDDETDQEPAKTPTTETTKKVIESNNLDEKALHSKIEELDKKGKAYFKNKQVKRFGKIHFSGVPILDFCLTLCFSPPFSFYKLLKPLLKH